MQPEQYDIMHQLEEDFWWHAGMRSIMHRLLAGGLGPDSRLLDVGCGTGGRLQELGQRCQTWGIDIHPKAVELCQQRGLENIQQGDATNLPFADDSFSHLLCCEVLQNLPNDLAGAQEAFRVLQPGGLYYISEQAYPFLRTQHDVSQQALRRYTKSRLSSILRQSGFRIERITHANTLLFPAMLGYRLMSKTLHPPDKVKPGAARSDLTELPAPVNSLLKSMLSAESAWLAKRSLPFGLTLIAIGRKLQD